MTFFENIGESNPVFLYNYILKSGAQTITIQIYPKKGEQFIAENADFDLKLMFA